MGVSTDGILCYGIDLNKEDEGSPKFLQGIGGEGMEFEDFLAKLEGIESPKVPYSDDTKPLYKKYWDKKNGLEEKYGIELVYHCSGDYPMHILAILESKHRAHRGCPEKLGQEIVAKKEWKDTLKDFCKKAGIKYEEPQWLLCSNWG
jgi:hypothetical protein